ncbi:MAG: hypothetical protein FWJ93_04940 [Micromonosporaceae bacterium]
MRVPVLMVLTASRNRTATGTGVLAAGILVLAFGNPAYVDWVPDNTNPDTAGGWFLRLLAWPAWRFSSEEPLRDLIAADLKAILLIVFAAVFLATFGAPQKSGGRVSALLAGWAACIFAAAVAGLVAALLLTDPSLLGAFQAAGAGGAYGLFTGWIIGLAALAGKHSD